MNVDLIMKESECHHSIGSLIDGAHPSLKTDGDYLGRYCPKTFETAEGKKVSPIYQAPNAMTLRFFLYHKHTQQLSLINNNHLEQSTIRERKRGGCRLVFGLVFDRGHHPYISTGFGGNHFYSTCTCIHILIFTYIYTNTWRLWYQD